MPSTQQRHSLLRLDELESYNRIINIPIVNSGLNIAGSIYSRIKKTNNVLTWTLDQAEDTLKAVNQNPALTLFEAPIHTIDQVICKSLDIVENKLPSINLPPKLIYDNTKDYISDVSTQILKPVLKRADSVKQIGNNVLTNKYTEYAADKLDDALDVADSYIDKYLPDSEDQRDSKDEETIPDTTGKKALHTIQHVDRVSKKLQRRLTKRTIEHAKIIKEQSTEAIHVFFYTAELVLTDPKLAYQKGKELWTELSKDEPENQARPKNVEELFVLVVRESARKFVHLVNFSSEKIVKLPAIISKTSEKASLIINENTEIIVKTFHLEEVIKMLVEAEKEQKKIVNFILQEIESVVSRVMEAARQPDPVKPSSSKNALLVPKIKVNSKASNNKGSDHSNNHNHGNHYDNIHDNHGKKKNGAQHTPSYNKTNSDSN